MNLGANALSLHRDGNVEVRKAMPAVPAVLLLTLGSLYAHPLFLQNESPLTCVVPGAREKLLISLWALPLSLAFSFSEQSDGFLSSPRWLSGCSEGQGAERDPKGAESGAIPRHCVGAGPRGGLQGCGHYWSALTGSLFKQGQIKTSTAR